MLSWAYLQMFWEPPIVPWHTRLVPYQILNVAYFFQATSGRPSQLLIVAVEANTLVTVTTTAAATGFEAGVPRLIVLGSLQTFLIEASSGNQDLTGTLITSR